MKLVCTRPNTRRCERIDERKELQARQINYKMDCRNLLDAWLSRDCPFVEPYSNNVRKWLSCPVVKLLTIGIWLDESAWMNCLVASDDQTTIWGCRKMGEQPYCWWLLPGASILCMWRPDHDLWFASDGKQQLLRIILRIYPSFAARPWPLILVRRKATVIGVWVFASAPQLFAQDECES